MKRRRLVQQAFSLLAAACAVVLGSISYATAALPDVVSDRYLGNWSGRNCFSVDVDHQSVAASSGRVCEVTIRAFGVFPVKEISVVYGDEQTVTVCGTPFGCVLNTQNILVVGTTDVETSGGLVNPASKAGVKVGDVIGSINGKEVSDISDVTEAIEKSKGSALTLVCQRDGATMELEVTPVFSKTEQKYKLGIWVRDSEAGIGMLSFYSGTDRVCVGLGHALNDSDTGCSFTMTGGTAYRAQILSVKKGAAGNPGQVCGCIQSNKRIGEVLENSSKGIYIQADKMDGVSMKLARKSTVELGDAQLYAALEGEAPQYYDVRIERIVTDAEDNKNLVIRVTDEDLIALTGGIVQGMSGCPIVQNGKLVGAVTHVMVNDPTKGYGIFAETMLETAQTLTPKASKTAS